MSAQAQLDLEQAHVHDGLNGNLATWTGRLTILWLRRGLLLRVSIVSLVVSTIVVLLIPSQYESTTRIMPPEQGNNSASLLALASRSANLSPLTAFASSLMGTRTSTALFISLLQSGTVTDHLVTRFQLQSVYRKRYRVDAAKRLARSTHIFDDKRSGVITIQVSDRDPRRARDLAQGYLDELNNLVRQTSNSAARQERLFLEHRLRTATTDLDCAQTALSEYSARNNTVDLKEQTRATVDAAARLEAEIVLARSTLSSLRQIYGDANIRVREAQARMATLQVELRKVSGLASDGTDRGATQADTPAAQLYPPLRQLPRLAVRYANLYRTVRVQEMLFELLTQQYEAARIEEAKDTPAVNVIDSPGVPEKKSFPPRTLLVLGLTLCCMVAAGAYVLFATRCTELPFEDERKALARDIVRAVRSRAGLPLHWSAR